LLFLKIEEITKMVKDEKTKSIKDEKAKKNEEKDELFNGKDLVGTQSTEIAEIKMQEDLLLPRYQLMQALSDAVQSGESKSGRIRHSITGEESDKVKVICLANSITRIMFDPENRAGAPLCISLNGKTGSVYGTCQECTQKDFKKDAEGKTVAPACSKVYNFLVIKETEIDKNTMPTILSFTKSSRKAGQKIFTSSAGWLKPLPIWTYVWEIGTTQKTSPKGTFYILTANQVRQTNDKERKFLSEVAGRFSKTEIQPEISPDEISEE
jgi:hypothetical protein